MSLRLFPGGPEIEHPLFEEVSEDEQVEYLADLLQGVLLLGVPEAYTMAEAIYYGDQEQFWKSLQQVMVIHSMWYVGYEIAMLWDLVRHGGKNRMTFHAIMQGVRAMAGMVYKRLALTSPVILATAAVVNQYVWNEIGDVKTGSVYWAQGGMMSGGSMPVISGTLDDLPTWSDVKDWWQSL